MNNEDESKSIKVITREEIETYNGHTDEPVELDEYYMQFLNKIKPNDSLANLQPVIAQEDLKLSRGIRIFEEEEEDLDPNIAPIELIMDDFNEIVYV